MGAETPVKHGYQRLDAVSAGPGAIERLWATHAQLQEPDCQRVREQVSAVFDRSLHLTLPEADANSNGPVIALGTTELRNGPLLVQVETPAGFSFRSLGCDRGVSYSIDLMTNTDGSAKLVFQFPYGTVVDIEIALLPLLPASNRHQLQVYLDKFTHGSPIVSAQQRLIRWLIQQDESDGLGFLSQLAAFHQGAAPDDLLEIVITVVVLLTIESECPSQVRAPSSGCQVTDRQALRSEMQCLIDLIGQGPGATPSGDDFLSGLLLGLCTVSDVNVRERVQGICQILISTAQGRTTPFSQELLTEACKHRGSEPAIQCLRTLTATDFSDRQRRDSAQALLELGHTSGMDLLAGLLTVTSAVLPIIVARGEP